MKCTFTVFVTDANDPPTISAQSFDVLESASIGHTVGTIQAFDPDGDTSLVFADMTTIPHPFTVEPSTGAIKVSSSLDFEGSMQSVSLRIFVTDSAGTPSAKSALILINVKDDNDAPTFASMDVFIPERCAPGSGSDAQCQVQLAGTDQDDENSPATGKGSPLSWSLSGSHVGKAGGCGDTFVLDASSGVLSANASASATPLDYERHPNGCTVWVELTDSAALTSQFEVLVRIVDVNEPPHLSEALCANPTVSENVPVGTNVTACALLIQDPDTRALPPQDVTVLQAAGAEFGLHAELTMLDHIYMTVSKHIDFETSPTITVSFFMRDDGTPVAIQDSDIVVTVIDVNEPPVFRNVDSARSISEGASPAALVTGPTLQATDPDVGQTATLKYRVAVSPSNDEHFEIQVSTGAISVRAGASLNYETNPTLNFPVTVTDSGDIAVSAIVIITVNNANDAPTINTAVVTTKIPITPASGSKVGPPFAASDEDFGHGERLTFHAESSSDWDHFTLDSESGQVSVGSDNSDLTVGMHYTLKVRVQDPENAFSDWATLSVNVVQGISVPIFKTGQSYDVLENTDGVSGSAVTNDLKCTDNDNDALSFAIIGVTSEVVLDSDGLSTGRRYAKTGPFSVDSGAGKGRMLVQSPGLDYEQVFAYNVTVTCTDTVGFEDSTVITIRVLDEPDAPFLPAASSGNSNGNITVGENARTGSLVGVVRVTDEDFYDLIPAPAGQLTFKIADSASPSPFAVHRTGIRIAGTTAVAVNVTLAEVAPGSSENSVDLHTGTPHPAPVCNNVRIDFDASGDDVGSSTGVLQFSQRQQGFVAYLTSTNNWPSKPYSDGVELTAGTGLGSQNGHYSGVLAVFNQGATKASFVDTDATCSMKKVYAYDKFGEYIGESPEACQQELSINVSATKHNALSMLLKLIR